MPMSVALAEQRIRGCKAASFLCRGTGAAVHYFPRKRSSWTVSTRKHTVQGGAPEADRRQYRSSSRRKAEVPPPAVWLAMMKKKRPPRAPPLAT